MAQAAAQPTVSPLLAYSITIVEYCYSTVWVLINNCYNESILIYYYQLSFIFYSTFCFPLMFSRILNTLNHILLGIFKNMIKLFELLLSSFMNPSSPYFVFYNFIKILYFLKNQHYLCGLWVFNLLLLQFFPSYLSEEKRQRTFMNYKHCRKCSFPFK